MLACGTTAPPFSLSDHTGRWRALADHRGHWLVLWWYPRACSEVCSVQARSLAPASVELCELGAAILGISFDPAADNARFAAQEGLGFPLLSDETREVGRAYNVVRRPDELFSDAPRRRTYLIDPDGVIRGAYQVQDVAVHGATLVADLRRLTVSGER
jgi:peroxiredoxin Q/BCP